MSTTTIPRAGYRATTTQVMRYLAMAGGTPAVAQFALAAFGAFYGVNGHVWVEHLLTSLPGGQLGFLIVVNILIFVLAFFLDFFEIAFIVIPLLAPAAEALGIDLIWFGVLICINLQTSFMHPPFGFALFYLRGIAPKEVRSSDIYWGAIPWVGLQLVLVAIVILWPESVTYWIDRDTGVDPSTVRIEVPLPDMPEDDAPPVFR